MSALQKKLEALTNKLAPLRLVPKMPPQEPNLQKPKNSKLRQVLLGLIVVSGSTWGGIQLYRKSQIKPPPPPPVQVDNATVVRQKNTAAVSLYQQSRYQEALAEFESALSIDPRQTTLMINLAAVYKELKVFDKAESLLKDALELDPENAVAHNNLGSVYLAQGKSDSAIEHFEQAKVHGPNYAAPRLNLAILFEQQEQWTKSVENYIGYINRGQNDQDVTNSLKERIRKLLSLSRDKEEGRKKFGMVQ